MWGPIAVKVAAAKLLPKLISKLGTEVVEMSVSLDEALNAMARVPIPDIEDDREDDTK